MKTKYIFVSGGVISALGKGVTAASISMLLKQRGYSVCPIKCENNLNVDFGTINPIEHGDPFLCFDGLEGDQDLGNYERFLAQEVGFDNFMTMGQLYLSVIGKERRMEYDGEDVEPIPHIVDEIITRFKTSSKKHKADFTVVELGGTVGEYENNNGLYYEAARILGLTEPVAHVHVTYIPVPSHIHEPKTKPAQFGIRSLMSMGINVNFIVCRSSIPIDNQRKYKFSQKFHIDPRDVFSAENLDQIYEVPLHLHAQSFDERILNYFGVKSRPINLAGWKKLVKATKNKRNKKVTIAIVGKYFGTGDSNLFDSYYALIEALKHSGTALNTEVDLKFINSDKEEKNINRLVSYVDGVVVPIGWGVRGVQGKIEAIRYAREHKIPYLGLCFGMQLACVEFAQNVLKLERAHSEEIDPNAKNKVIHSIPFDPKYQIIKGDGCSMRLGTFDCVLKKGTTMYEIYKKHKAFKDEKKMLVAERHRHRFEFNNAYREKFEKKGLVIAGTSPDNFFVEFIELPKKIHPFFVATQGHPEYRSTPLHPHPIFPEFLSSAYSIKNRKK